MVLTKVKVPFVLGLEMSSAYIQVLLRVKGEPKLPSSSVRDWSKQDTEVHAWIPCPLHISFAFEWFSITVCSSYIGLHKLGTPYAFQLNLSLMKYWRQK